MPVFNTPIVFINYRRDDSKSEARNLNNDLENAFGKGFVFRDLDDIRSGTIWIDKLKEAGSNAKVILAVIGPDWLQINDKGESRLNDPKDWVRQELEQAIAAQKKIIPVLVKGAPLPDKASLPKSLHPLFKHQYFILRDDKWNLDLTALIKDISDLSATKTIEQKAREEKEKRVQEKEATSKKKIWWMSAALVGLLVVLFGYIFWPTSDQPVTKDPVIPGLTDDGHGNTNLANTDNTPKDFCPEFESDGSIKTLLYPLKIEGQDINIGSILKQTISKICISHQIQSEVKTPNIDKEEFYDAHDAKRKCETCTSDIFVTGICYAESAAKFGLSANLGFCNPIYNGYDLDQDKLSIEASNFTIGDLVSDSNIYESFEYTIEIILGIYQIKNGNIEEGVKMIQKAIRRYPKSKDIEIVARDILWQAQYKLNRKAAASATLDAFYKLDPSKIRPLILKADINFKSKNYQEAIKDINIILAKKPNPKSRDKLLERRGDSYYEVKQYDNAKADYKSIKTIEVGSKIKNTDNKIKANFEKIMDLEEVTDPTVRDKSSLINLYIQNGIYQDAIRVFGTIPPSKYDTPEKMSNIGIKLSTINALHETEGYLPPTIKNSILKVKTQNNNITVIEN